MQFEYNLKVLSEPNHTLAQPMSDIQLASSHRPCTPSLSTMPPLRLPTWQAVLAAAAAQHAPTSQLCLGGPVCGQSVEECKGHIHVNLVKTTQSSTQLQHLQVLTSASCASVHAAFEISRRSKMHVMLLLLFSILLMWTHQKGCSHGTHN